ncbi:unnamed protein product [Calicophoron daubneyi]|uniref:RNA polymerase-associated protein LEO1 n=1 Tax=Calicophoron daubneyi TaxID=300641 RepID=A0AAV2TZ19_CALDB
MEIASESEELTEAPNDGARKYDSSDLDSFSEDSDDLPQNVITQKDVFGSDTESEDHSPSKEEQPTLDRAENGSEVGSDEGHGDADRAESSPDVTGSDNSATHSVKKKKSNTVALSDLASDSDDAAPYLTKKRTQQPQHTGLSDEDGSSPKEDIHDTDKTGDEDEALEREEEEEDHDGEQSEAEGEDGNQEADETRIAVDFPLIRADLGKEMHLVKMPNFLSVETRPFDPNFYEDELDEDEVLDEEGRTRLKLKVENTIRWRMVKTPEGDVTHESNARIVRWSDGSLSLHLGDEIFDIHKVDIHSDYNYLFIREGSGLQGQSSLRTKLTFRPHSTDSFTHRKITLSLADKTNKSQKVKILPVAGADPESNRNALVRKEEEKLRATLRRESQLRRMRERQAMSRSSFGSDRRRSYGDEDEDEDANTTSLNALKRNAKAAFKASRRDVSAIYSSDSESLSDISEPKSRKKIPARISDEEESS